MCICVPMCMSNHVPHLSAKKIVQLRTFAAEITFHNRQADLKLRGSLAPHTVQQSGRDFFLIHSLFSSASFNSLTMAQLVPTDPTKMGEGRAIAVLTSGGDAQGEYGGFAGWWVSGKCLGTACTLLGVWYGYRESNKNN